MTAIPQAYLDIMLPLIRVARGHLEQGRALRPMAFLGNLTTREAIPVVMDCKDDEAVERSVREVKRAAESLAADFIFMIMEAWTVDEKHRHRRQEIIERVGATGASPHKIDIVGFSLETRHGIWTAQCDIEWKDRLKKQRTFGEVTFIRNDGAKGWYLHLLPGAGAGPVALH